MAEAADDTPPPIGHQADPLQLTGPPTQGVTSRDVQMHAPRLRPIKDETAVHLEEGEMRADENGVIRGVFDVEFHGAASGIQGNRLITHQPLARFHPAPPCPGPMGCSTCSTRMPSPKRHSILIVPMSSATPSSTSSARSVLWPTCSTSSYEAPPRAASCISSQMSASASG